MSSAGRHPCWRCGREPYWKPPGGGAIGKHRRVANACGIDHVQVQCARAVRAIDLDAAPWPSRLRKKTSGFLCHFGKVVVVDQTRVVELVPDARAGILSGCWRPKEAHGHQQRDSNENHCAPQGKAPDAVDKCVDIAAENTIPSFQVDFRHSHCLTQRSRRVSTTGGRLSGRTAHQRSLEAVASVSVEVGAIASGPRATRTPGPTGSSV